MIAARLGAIQFLRGLPTADLEVLARKLRLATFAAGDVVFREGGTRVGLRTDPYGATRAVWQGLR